jgi:uncharacterized membrane protein required for colicin V production
MLFVEVALQPLPIAPTRRKVSQAAQEFGLARESQNSGSTRLKRGARIMGLDLTLGALILFFAIRGWIKGFVYHSVRIGGLIACVYAADPVRELARPYVLDRLPKIPPALMDRILWWVAAVVSYIVLVGLITLAIQIMRTPAPAGMIRSNRSDKMTGFLLGAAKGLVIAALLVAGLQTYGNDLIKNAAWAQQQTHDSRALKWSDQYQPVPRIWSIPAVQQFVNQIERNRQEPSQQPGGDGSRQVAEAPTEAEAESAADSVDDIQKTAEEIAEAVAREKAKLQLGGPMAD